MCSLSWLTLPCFFFYLNQFAVGSLKASRFYLKKPPTFTKVLFFLHQKEEMVSRSCDTELDWLWNGMDRPKSLPTHLFRQLQ